jgi:hypothetical protein
MSTDKEINIHDDEIKRLDLEITDLKSKRARLNGLLYELSKDKYTKLHTRQDLIRMLREQVGPHTKGTLFVLNGVLYVKMQKPNEHWGLRWSDDRHIVEYGLHTLHTSYPDSWHVHWNVSCVVPKSEAQSLTSVLNTELNAYKFDDLERFIEFKFIWAQRIFISNHLTQNNHSDVYVSASEQK